jgi:hypothetical protein
MDTICMGLADEKREAISERIYALDSADRISYIKCELYTNLHKVPSSDCNPYHIAKFQAIISNYQAGAEKGRRVLEERHI